MKTPRTILATISLILIFGAVWKTPAQEKGSPETTLGKVYSPPTVKTLPSGESVIEVQQVLPAPTSGVFYPMYGNFPPTPFPPNPDLDLPVYFWGEGIFVFDDEGLNLQTLRETGVPLFSPGTTESMAMLGEDGPPTPGEGGEGEGGDEPYPLPEPFSYTNGLWLSIYSYDTNWMTLLAHGTVADEYYEILTKTNLSTTNWTVDHGFIGQDDLTLANPISVAGQSSLFFWARNASRDEDGDGLPDWWELEHGLDPTLADTGNTGTPDGYKDPDGDGWSNLEEFQNGSSPSAFNTPPAPRGLTVALSSGGTNANLNWNPSGGAVTGYTIQRYSYETGVEDFPVAATNHAYTDSAAPAHVNPNYLPPRYRIQAQYASGDSEWSEYVFTTATGTEIMFWRTRGPGGRSYIIASGLAPDVTAVKVTWLDYDFYPAVPHTFSLSMTNFTNGVGVVPEAQMQIREDYQFWIQAAKADGSLGDYVPVNSYHQSIPFFDGREQLKQNLTFLLRAADKYKRFKLFLLKPGFSYGTYSDPYTDGYAYSSFYNIDPASEEYPSYAYLEEFRPFVNNYHYRNFVLDPGYLTTGGQTTTGAEDAGDYAVLHFPTAVYQFQYPTNLVSIPSVLPASTTTNLIHPYYVDDIGVIHTNNDYVMEASPKNIFGLSYLSAREPHGGTFTDLFPGNTIPFQENYLYPRVDEPVTHLVDYYFGHQYQQDQPGQLEFSPTNTTQMLFVSGNSPDKYPFFGYAKLALDNGDTNKFAYLGLYFDKAYKVNTDGSISTNQNGLLSEYGEYFPFEPGRVWLTTKPTSDGETNIAGCLVHAIKLEVDANHDGTINHSITGPDNTSYLKPFVFWVNNDNDGEYVSDDFPGKDRDLPKKPDNADGEIKSVRDLEDFARLWVSGLPVHTGELHATLHWEVYSGAPAIKLYRAAENNGGIGYLTNLTTAKEQIDIPGRGTQYDNELRFSYGTVAGTEPVEISFNGNDLHFLFEGAGIGSGELTLTILKGTQPLAQTAAFFDLKDIKQMYEQVLADNVSSDFPPSTLTSQFKITRPLSDDGSDAKQMIVFVHGINNTEWEYQITSETMFRRLYWSGYQGRFAAFHWPSPLLPNCIFPLRGSPLNYNKGEYIAFKSANAFKDYLHSLTNRLPDYSINIVGHSMGGMVASEALRLGAPFNNCILSQAAVPAHAYDVNAPFLQILLDKEQTNPTPFDTALGGYHGYFTNLTGNIINFYNPIDYALVGGECGPFKTNWEENHLSMKPVFIPLPTMAYGYSTNTQESYVDLTILETTTRRTLTDAYEKKAMVARSRSKAAGAEPGVAGVINSTNSVDLRVQFGFDRTRDEHSAQFTRNIQTVKEYYDRVIDIVDTP